MTDRRIDGFFYGLFMDADLLRKSQVVAHNPRRGYVDDYKLFIGQRATLAAAPGARAYGMIFALTHHELEKLYDAPGLDQYRPEPVLAHTLEGEDLPALCYNLPKAPGPDEVNAKYAASLRAVLEKLEFPAEYIKSIK